MSYKVKSLVYLVCFIISVVIYGQMESDTNPSDNKEVQLVQTNTDEHHTDPDNAL
jgi:hypothetical protein